MEPKIAAQAVIDTLRGASHDALLAGGCVRDALLGLPPTDYDVATSARPEEVMALFERTEAVGAQFGVVLVMVEGEPIEVATFRSDGAYVDGRHPESVHFSSAQEDARRRDFTINAMFYDTVKDVVVDHVGGQADLAAKRLRTVGEARERFGEDRLRMLRAVRFAARFELAVDPAIVAATQEMAGRIVEVSRERITDELLKIAAGPGLSRALSLMAETGLLAHLIPGNEADEAHVAVCDRLPMPRAATLGLAALVWGVDLADTLDRLRLSKSQREAVVAMLEISTLLGAYATWPVAARKRLLRREHFDDALVLAEAAAGRPLTAVRVDRESWSRSDLFPDLPVDGHDLMAMGVPPGPEVGRLLEALEDLALEGKITSEAEARAAVERLRK